MSFGEVLQYDHVNLIYFSPTKSTKKILQSVALGLQKEVLHFDITYPKAKLSDFSNELVIIGSPVHGGRLPAVAVERLKQIRAKNSLAILIVVYGNRDYEDALLELKDLCKEVGFTPIAGATFIAQHSYSSPQFPIAKDRPDELDLMQTKEFAKKIKLKLKSPHLDEDLKLPGNFPYKKISPSKILPPNLDQEVCALCGKCTYICPTGAIYMQDGLQIAKDLCIRCLACVEYCTEKAITHQDETLKAISEKLSKNCFRRKEPTFYL